MKHLLLKSVAGMLFLAFMMGAMLFLPNMSFNYPQAWIYLAAFFLPVAIITVYIFVYDKPLLQSRLSVGPVAEQRPVQKVIQSISALAFLAIYVVSSFDYRFEWSNVPQWLSVTSFAMIIISFVMLFFVFRENSFLSATIETKSNQTVISTGLYSFVRHPMYSGAALLIVFSPVALGSFWGLIPSLILLVTIAFRAIDEENELKTNLTGYIDYCKKVRWRFIPYLF